jgi:hypothetical protein
VSCIVLRFFTVGAMGNNTGRACRLQTASARCAPHGTSSSPSRVTGHGSRVTGHGSRVTGHGTRVTGHGSRDTGHGSRVTGHGSRVTGHGSRVTGHGTRDNPHGLRARLHRQRRRAMQPPHLMPSVITCWPLVPRVAVATLCGIKRRASWRWRWPDRPRRGDQSPCG